MASGSTAPFSGEFVDLENVPKLPEGISAGQILEQNADAIRQVAEARHAAGLSQVDADGGFFDVFVDGSKINSSSKTKRTNQLLKLGILGTYDISTATFSQSRSTRQNNSSCLAFNSDGTKLYEIDTGANQVFEFTLSTAFDISTASFNQSFSNVDGGEDLAFNSDGTKMYEIDDSDDRIVEYNLGTAFDISTASQNQTISSEGSRPTGLTFNNDGTKMYEIDTGASQVFESKLSTAFDISTASFNQSISTENTDPQGIAFNDDGTKMYEMGGGSGTTDIFESNLSTAFDISTASFNQSISSQSSDPKGIFWNNKGTKLFESDPTTFYESDVGSGLASNGTVTQKRFTFTDTQGNSFSPSKVGIFPDQTLNGQSITYDLKDSTGTVVKTFNQADLNQLQSVSTTDDTFQVEANFSGNGSQTPQLEFLDVRGV